MNVQATGVALAPRRVKLQGREHLIKEIVADFCSLKKRALGNVVMPKAFASSQRCRNLQNASGRKTAATSAGFHGVWILECESTFFQARVEVNFRAVQKEIAFLIDNHTHAMMFNHDVG